MRDTDYLGPAPAGRDVYVTYRTRMAVLGYALLTADGQWQTPGHLAGSRGRR